MELTLVMEFVFIVMGDSSHCDALENSHWVADMSLWDVL